MNTPLISVIQIDALLPQTQCTKCGYQGCLPYAQAIAEGDAINKCPPGGQAGIAKLAALLQQAEIPLDTTHGEEPAEHLIAFIREDECIGCTKCIQACPVDAIIGAAKLMHTVISDWCTGCDLCVAPCPVDCIDMIPAREQHPTAEQVAQKADVSRQRFQSRNQRLQALAEKKSARKQARVAFHEANVQGSAAVISALETVREKIAQQPFEEQQGKLMLNLASARERFDRADAKVKKAEKQRSDQLEQLKARRQDMQFKLEEIEKKLESLASEAPIQSSPASAAHSAVEKILAARSKKTDSERFASGIAIIDKKLQAAQEQLAVSSGEELFFLQEDIERLQQKRLMLLREMQQQETP